MSNRTAQIHLSIACLLCVVLAASNALGQDGDGANETDSETHQSAHDETASDESEGTDEDEGKDSEDEDESKASGKSEAEQDESEKISNKVILGKIGASAGNGGAIEDALTDGADSTSMEAAFEDSKGVKKGQEKDGTSGGTRSKCGHGSDDLKSSDEDRNPTVEVGFEETELSGEGELDAEIVRDVLRRRSRSRFFENCIEQSSLDVEDLPKNFGGKVEFEIGENGRVTRSKVTSDQIDDAAQSCSARSLERFWFPRPKGGAVEVEAKMTVRLEAPTGCK